MPNERRGTPKQPAAQGLVRMNIIEFVCNVLITHIASMLTHSIYMVAISLKNEKCFDFPQIWWKGR